MAEESAPSAPADQPAIKDHPGQEQPALRPGLRRNRGFPPGAVRDERGAGPSGDPEGFSRRRGNAYQRGSSLREDDHPVPECDRIAAAHRQSPHLHIFGYRSKKLIQVNVLWSSDGGTAADETIVGTANALRDYFATQNFRPDSVVANRQLAQNTILVFRGSDEQKRTVLLLLSGVAASPARRTEDKTKSPEAAAADPRAVIYRGCLRTPTYSGSARANSDPAVSGWLPERGTRARRN